MGSTALKQNGSIIIKYKKRFTNPLVLAETANQGLDAKDFFSVSVLTGFEQEILAGILNTSVKTFTRYRKSRKKLSPSNSEQLLKILVMYEAGKEVFGSYESFKKWLEKPAYGLGNKIPLNLLSTSTGIDLVIDEIKRIAYGDLA